jgi:hypothetical protein
MNWEYKCNQGRVGHLATYSSILSLDSVPCREQCLEQPPAREMCKESQKEKKNCSQAAF